MEPGRLYFGASSSYHPRPIVPFAIHVIGALAIAHAPACPDIPAESVTLATDYWLRFPTRDEANVLLNTLRSWGYVVNWCQCPNCRYSGL